MGSAACHFSGVKNFEVASIFLEKPVHPCCSQSNGWSS